MDQVTLYGKINIPEDQKKLNEFCFDFNVKSHIKSDGNVTYFCIYDVKPNMGRAMLFTCSKYGLSLSNLKPI